MATVEKKVFLQVPDIGSADKIELIKWYKKEEEEFEEGEELCEISTDKAVCSVEAPYRGKILKLLVEEKKEVKIGEEIAQVLFFIDEK